MRAILLLALGAVALGAAAPAAASVAELRTTTEPLLGGPLAEIRYTAAAGERNVVTAFVEGATWSITDAGADIRAGTGCVATTVNAVDCTNARPLAHPLVVVTGDGDDRVTLPDEPRSRVVAGAGDDVVRGSVRDDQIDAGAGADRIELRAVPGGLSCGSGDDLVAVRSSRLLFDDVELSGCERLRIARLTIAVRPLRRGNALTLAARCIATEPCSGGLTLRPRRSGAGAAPLGRAAIAIGAGERATVRVALDARARRLLDRTGTRVELDLTTAGSRARWRTG